MHEGQLAIIWLLLSTLALFAMIFGLRYMTNKENMAMIEKGLNPKEFANRPAPYKNLKWGLLLMGAGAGLFIAYLLDVYLLNDQSIAAQADHNPAIYFALIAFGGGLGLFGSYKMEKKWWDENKEKQ
ncbi:MAG TPA: DUF6249 domain-containing protein [Chitinophagaceae bacterium]|jgi:hypothetical protein|nr:DUF6249 domain-containing protein [Chitinophagaceae bacterium]